MRIALPPDCLMTPDLRQLRTFVTVAERGSFTRAAEDLYIAQQAVSQQIKALESAIGVRLLRRTSRRVELTRLANYSSPTAAAHTADPNAACWPLAYFCLVPRIRRAGGLLDL